MTRIGKRFDELKKQGKKGFVAYITAGDPDLKATHQMVVELDRQGVDVLELGVPFSDPIADGPTIQRSSFTALRHQYSLDDILKVVSEFRSRSETGIILMTYLNPVYQYGLAKLEEKSLEIGLDGILISDLTPEEYIRLNAFRNLDTIFLAAPTSSDERLQAISKVSSGFLYLVARTGVTGHPTDVAKSVPATLERIRKYTDLPVAVGFGITSKEDVKLVWQLAQGAVVGSAIVEFIEANIETCDLPARVGSMVQNLIPSQPILTK